MYWANELAAQSEDAALKATFEKVAADMKLQEDEIMLELNNAQGTSVDIRGYYHPDEDLVFKRMRPSKIFNNIVDNI